MRKTATSTVAVLSLTAFMGMSTALLPLTAGAEGEANADTIKLGKEVAFDRKKGNCLACHMIGDGPSPGNIGPPLVAMKARFPDKKKLHDQIWDPMVANPASRMPPFGKHQIISAKELDAIVEYLYTL